MKIPDFILRFFGRQIANKLQLEDTSMDETKKWYLSKGVWTGVVTAVLGLYVTLSGQFHWPAVPEFVFTVLGAIGVYTRVAATDKIG